MKQTVEMSGMFRQLIGRLVRVLISFLFVGMATLSVADIRTDALVPGAVAVVTNERFPGSVEVGEYYLKARGIPEKNLIRLSFDPAQSRLSVADFERFKDDLDRQLGPEIRVVLFVWTTPYAVACNSLTGAYTLGVQAELCSRTCDPSVPSAYFNQRDNSVLRRNGMRLSMLLPVESPEQAKALIDRGVAANQSPPRAKAFFLKTSDSARSSRAPLFPRSAEVLRPFLSIRTLTQDSIESENEIIVYQTGLVSVPHLETLHFLPGAVADHLTSFGGDLLGKFQMSSLRWLEAGATGSYGTVSEPCNHWQKFPHPGLLLANYLSGTTLIEAYWRSVTWPVQGLFIGEPLAAPYGR